MQNIVLYVTCHDRAGIAYWVNTSLNRIEYTRLLVADNIGELLHSVSSPIFNLNYNSYRLYTRAAPPNSAAAPTAPVLIGTAAPPLLDELAPPLAEAPGALVLAIPPAAPPPSADVGVGTPDVNGGAEPEEAPENAGAPIVALADGRAVLFGLRTLSHSLAISFTMEEYEKDMDDILINNMHHAPRN